VNASPYRLLAEGPATKGFATLRIDKRGMFVRGNARINEEQQMTVL
jgi:hypothetical protein